MEIFIIITLLFGFVFGENDVVKSDQGEITGSSLRSRNGREIKAFQGIPYAKPPTGDLRFKVNHTFLIYIIYIMYENMYNIYCIW